MQWNVFQSVSKLTLVLSKLKYLRRFNFFLNQGKKNLCNFLTLQIFFIYILIKKLSKYDYNVTAAPPSEGSPSPA